MREHTSALQIVSQARPYVKYRVWTNSVLEVVLLNQQVFIRARCNEIGVMKYYVISLPTKHVHTINSLHQALRFQEQEPFPPAAPHHFYIDSA